MVHVAVNKYDFEKINILEYAFGEGGGGHQKAYAVYAFINVDNCERPLSYFSIHLFQYCMSLLCANFGNKFAINQSIIAFYTTAELRFKEDDGHHYNCDLMGRDDLP